MTEVFISYSRKDKVFAKNFSATLQRNKLETWVDWDDIPPTADWLDQIHKGIEHADAFLLLLSPDSVSSKVCRQEVDHAVQNGKRLIPIVARDVNSDDVHPALAKINWIFCRDTDDYGEAINKILLAIRTDLDWVEALTRLQVRAIEWNEKLDVSLLLRGNDLKQAEELLATSGQKDPQPTDLQRTYLLESRKRESKTRNRLLTISSLATFLLVGLFILAVIQLNSSRALLLGAQAQTAFSEGNYNLARLYAYQADQIRENEPATKVLRALPFEDFPLKQALLGHTEGVNSVAWSRDGRLASGADDSNVIVWDTETNRPAMILSGHTWNVCSVAWSQDGILASGSADGTIIIWNLETGQPTQTIETTLSTFCTLAWSQDGKLAWTTLFGEIVIWDVIVGKKVQTFTSHGETVDGLAWVYDGHLASGSDNVVILWNVETGEPLQILEGHTSSVRSIAWSADGRLASAAADRTIIIWDLKSGEPAKTMSFPTYFLSIGWSTDGRLASDGGDKVVIWDTQSGQAEQVITGHKAGVTSVAWSEDGRLASGSWDTTIMIHKPQAQPLAQTLKGHTGSITSIAWAQDGTLASGSDDRTIIIWDLKANRPTRILRGHTDYITSIAWSNDGRLASGGADDKVIIWNLETGEPEQTLTGHTDVIQSVAWSPDGKLASGSMDRTIRIWNVDTQEPPQVLGGLTDTDHIEGVAWSNDGRLASASWDGHVIIWDLKSGQPAQILEGYTDFGLSVAWGRDRRLASGSSDPKVIFWNLENSQSPQILEGHTFPVKSLAWSPDGRLASSNGQAAWSPDGKLAASVHETIIWNMETGRPMIIMGDSTKADSNVYILREDFVNQLPCEKWLFRNMTISEWLAYQGVFFMYKPACPSLPTPPLNINLKDLSDNTSYVIQAALITWPGRLILIGVLLVMLAISYHVMSALYGVGILVRKNFVRST